ncbi:transglycosylase domain-containing protein [Nitrospirillum viridazoti]|nr:PBP1A family penicillin-binding protein [Nitrospirillum amazonense]
MSPDDTDTSLRAFRPVGSQPAPRRKPAAPAKAATPRVAPRPRPDEGDDGAGGGNSGGGQPPRRRPPPVRRPAPKRRSGGPRMPWWVKTLVVLGIWGVMVFAGVVAYFAYDLPEISQVAQFQRRPAVTVLAADGSKLARFGDMRGETLEVSEISPDLVHAVLAVEDRRFYSHFGVDPIGIARAAWTDYRTGHMRQGASTITQQLARNLFLSPAKTMRRKVQEAMLALMLEHRYTKDQILGAYLNRVYLGSGTYGVDAAARTYFDKPATEVNLREAAIIAGLLKAPSKYSPSANNERAEQRMAVVLATMVDAGYITVEQAKAVVNQPAQPRANPSVEGDGRYFAAWVADQVNAFIGPNHGDLVVHTTYDAKMQRAATAHVAEILNGPGAAANVHQAAVVIMAPDGAVKAMVGGRDYDESQFNRATQALRQPGSSFKPFVYLAALEAGRTPDDLILDAPYKRGKWEPKNYEPGYMGEIPLRTALAHSVNTATIRLLESVGIDRAIAVARRLGITAPLRRDLSLALGTSEVTPLELTGAYTAIANGGRAVFPYGITEIRDADDSVLYQRKGSGAGYAIAAAEDANLVRMMMGVVQVGTGKSAQLADRPIAGKTGTTQDYRDAWFMGFTADYVTGVWLGNDDGDEMKRITGGTLPAKLWKAIMTDLEQGLPVRDLIPLQPAAVQDQAPDGPAVPPLPTVETVPLDGAPTAAATPAPGVPTVDTTGQIKPEAVQKEEDQDDDKDVPDQAPSNKPDPIGDLLNKLKKEQ